jgi:hypothetical protein
MENNPFSEAADESAAATDQKYTQEIAGFVKLSQESIAALFPTPTDKQNLMKLIDIVRNSTSDMDVLPKLADTASGIGLAAIKLIKSILIV